MICAVINGPTYSDAEKQLNKALNSVRLVELRLDLFNEIDLSKLSRLQANYPIPMIFTLRSKRQRGNYSQSEEKRLEQIFALAALKPEFLDIEYDVPKSFIDSIASLNPSMKLIISHHDFERTPENLNSILDQMPKDPAYLYKFAFHANSSLDAMRLLNNFKHKKNIIPISMGNKGQISRILNPILNGNFTYASFDDNAIAPGQLPTSILTSRYRYDELNNSTEIYGLIGDPVDLSISDQTHNAAIKKLTLNAVYVKLPVAQQEIGQFLHSAKSLPIRGLSVTMPLKELVQPYLDYIDPKAQQIGAVNTLCLNEGKISGYNTDCFGALNAIEKKMKVKGKKIVIIGAGGAAKGIAFEASLRGAILTIINRDKNKAEQLADRLNCKGKGLEEMPSCYNEGYDIIINTTPAEMPINPQYILQNCLAMDIKNRPIVTPFLKQAKEKNCTLVYGYEMFVEQAVGQFNLWFNNKAPADLVRDILLIEAEKVLDSK